MRRRLICFTLFICLLGTVSKAQSTNPCGVKAVISPGNDSILTGQVPLNLQSASINATSYRFFLDTWLQPINTPVTWGIGPGLTKISLVAYNGACTDTATVWYFWSGKYPAATDNSSRIYGYADRMHEATRLINVSTGGYLLSGHRSYNWVSGENQQGLLIKTKEEGCVEWARKLVSTYGSDIRRVKESADGGFFVFAEAEYRQFIVKLDAAGNLLWSKRLELWGGSSNVIGYGMESLPDGGVVISGAYPTIARPVLIRLDNTGNIVWQRDYDYNFSSANDFQYVTLKGDHLYVGGSACYNNCVNFDAFLFKVDVANGQTVWVKKYTNQGAAMNIRHILDIDSTLLVNIATSSNLPNTPSIGGVMRLDTAGQVLQASVVAENYTPNTLSGPYTPLSSQLIRSGKTFYMISAGQLTLSLQPYTSYYTKLVKIDSNFNYTRVQTYGGAGASRFFYNAAAPKDGFAIAGAQYGAGISPHSGASLLSIKVIDSTGGNPNANCFFWEQPFVVAPVNIIPQTIQWNAETPTNYLSVTRDVPLVAYYPEMRFICPDYVDSCSYLKISGPASVCNLNDILTYKTHKNKGCGQPTVWEVPAGVQIIHQTDSSISVKVPAFGRYVIYGTNPLSCVPVQDSMVVLAQSKTPPLDLGPDQRICPQNRITLHAGPHFMAYEWQDGSTDSLLTVHQPGQYRVKATDSCGNLIYDTVDISLEPPIPFSIGPDRMKCNDDTLRLQAPAGFMNYNWSPNYNINTITGQQVIIQPAADTAYTITAEKTPGCFAYDTIRISVYHSPVIDLGPDRSFCAGDSAVFDGGPGFRQYTWSNGAATQQATLFSAGNYSIMATTNQGCTSYDTVTIVNVFDNPVVQLGNDPALCVEGLRVLKPGNFRTYVWQDGSTGASYHVTALGRYYVTVTDQNNCAGSDTIDITRWIKTPSKFLPADTSLCSYARMDLHTLRPFNHYAWSNGSSAPSITISLPGMYWLEATDENNCTGKDTIVIAAKDCLFGLYVPSAFSPNNDGKNDVFKPLLFGNIKQYRFTIYNRWGQSVFSTTDPAKGWDGRHGAYDLSSNVFVWLCVYQLEGEEIRTAKGTVTIVR